MLTFGLFLIGYTPVQTDLVKRQPSTECKILFMFPVSSCGCVESYSIHMLSINYSKLTVTIVIKTKQLSSTDDERPLIAVN